MEGGRRGGGRGLKKGASLHHSRIIDRLMNPGSAASQGDKVVLVGCYRRTAPMFRCASL
jgi:hypothetical protein